jgi:hypothetical protein
MTLAEMSSLLPIPYEEARALALVYPHDVAVALYGVQSEHGDPRHVPAGVQLVDGRWMLCGDVLSEIGEGGILSGAWQYVTTEMMDRVDVIPWADAVALLPPAGGETL